MSMLLVPVSVYAITRSYHIGNSLTQDSLPRGIAALAESRGLEHDVGYHIRSSASLNYILANPTETSVELTTYGTFQEALPNYDWDVVTIQPHPGNSPQVTLGTDTQSVLSFINLTRTNPANQETNFYIYQTWPQFTGTPYHLLWDRTDVDNEPDTTMSRSRLYYQYLIENVRSQTDANVYMVPTGEVFYALDAKIRAGELPGFTSISQFYRDVTHLHYEKGRFIASATTFSTILGQYPTGLEKLEGVYGDPAALTPEQTEIILETIRDVLDNHPYSGVEMPGPFRADFNNDLQVDEVDLQTLERSLGVQEPYDIDLDGDVDGRDFLAWQRSYQPTIPDFTGTLVDLNGDGLYSPADVQVWQDSYGVGAGADLDGDGDTDGRDFLLWQRSTPSFPADLDDDYLVNGIELDKWHSTYGFEAVADANGDGEVTLADYEIWQEEEGRPWTYPAALVAPPLASQTSGLNSLSVPEPDTWKTVVVGILLALTIVQRGSQQWSIHWLPSNTPLC